MRWWSFAVLLGLSCSRSALEVSESDACAPCAEAVPSCRVLHERDPSLQSGRYELGDCCTTWDAYCDMEAEGGWTLLLKVDGERETFRYDAPLWSNAVTLDAEADLALVEAKYRGFSDVSFDALRIDMVDANTAGAMRHMLRLDVPAASLLALLHAGFSDIDVPREDWLGLVDGAMLQQNCNRAGFNVSSTNPEHSRVRIGVIANQEDDCNTPDSFVGIGAAEHDATISAGNFCESFWCKPGSSLSLARFAYVFAR